VPFRVCRFESGLGHQNLDGMIHRESCRFYMLQLRGPDIPVRGVCVGRVLRTRRSLPRRVARDFSPGFHMDSFLFRRSARPGSPNPAITSTSPAAQQLSWTLVSHCQTAKQSWQSPRSEGITTLAFSELVMTYKSGPVGSSSRVYLFSRGSPDQAGG